MPLEVIKMSKVKFSDVVVRANTKEDRHNTDLEFYVGGEHIDTDEVVIEKRGLIAGSTIGPMFYFGFKAGQVLFVSRNPHLRKAGMVTFDGICSEKTFVLETKNESVLLQRYLPFILQSDHFWAYAEAHKSGSVNFFINWSTLADYEFELPGIQKQQELADVLWAMTETRLSYKRLLMATDELIKSRFVELFGEPGSDDKGWGLTTLGECCELNPKRPRNISDDLLVSFVPMPAVSENGKMDCSDVRLYSDVKKGFTYFAENDVLFAKITPCMENGKGAIATGLSNGIGSGSTEFHVLRPKSGISNPYWIYILTMFDNFRLNAKKVMTGTGGQLRVPAYFLKEYPISLPPIELQEQFESFVVQSNISKDEIQMSIDRLTSAYRSVLSENFA